MDAHDFQPGDTVKLKSGGPLMTVDGVGKYGMGATQDSVLCVWFEAVKGQQVKKTDTFGPHLLVKE